MQARDLVKECLGQRALRVLPGLDRAGAMKAPERFNLRHDRGLERRIAADLVDRPGEREARRFVAAEDEGQRERVETVVAEGAVLTPEEDHSDERCARLRLAEGAGLVFAPDQRDHVDDDASGELDPRSKTPHLARRPPAHHDLEQGAESRVHALPQLLAKHVEFLEVHVSQRGSDQHLVGDPRHQRIDVDDAIRLLLSEPVDLGADRGDRRLDGGAQAVQPIGPKHLDRERPILLPRTVAVDLSRKEPTRLAVVVRDDARRAKGLLEVVKRERAPVESAAVHEHSLDHVRAARQVAGDHETRRGLPARVDILGSVEGNERHVRDEGRPRIPVGCRGRESPFAFRRQRAPMVLAKAMEALEAGDLHLSGSERELTEGGQMRMGQLGVHPAAAAEHLRGGAQRVELARAHLPIQRPRVGSVVEPRAEPSDASRSTARRGRHEVLKEGRACGLLRRYRALWEISRVGEDLDPDVIVGHPTLGQQAGDVHDVGARTAQQEIRSREAAHQRLHALPPDAPAERCRAKRDLDVGVGVRSRLTFPPPPPPLQVRCAILSTLFQGRAHSPTGSYGKQSLWRVTSTETIPRVDSG